MPIPPGIWEFAILGIPIIVGFLCRKDLSRLANFAVMVAVFQLDLFMLASLSSGRLRLGVFVPYTVVAIIPALAAHVAGRYSGPFVTACIGIIVFYVGSVLLAFYGSHRFLPIGFFAGIFLSWGDLLAPLVFVLVARLAYPHHLRAILQ
jgi:hypothetical protein